MARGSARVREEEGTDSFVLSLEAVDTVEAQESSISPRTSTSSPPPRAAVSSPTPSSSSTNEVFSSTEKRKRPTPTPVEDAILQRLKDIDKEKEKLNDEDHAFGVMVTGMLAKLPAQDRMEAKFEIHQLLYQLQKQAYQMNSSQ
ncbi:unnamed protein product [Leuciscus chuanchicus]